MVILLPALTLILAMVIAGGRLALAHQAVQSSAATAARTASIARTHTQAASSATTTAGTSLREQRTRCRSITVTVDTTGFTVPVGTPADVAATVTCQLDLAGLVPGLPGTMNVAATARSPLDTYRER